MRMCSRIAMLMVTVLLAGSLVDAKPSPKRWYKDWKWWVGEALIAGIRAADVHSSMLVRSRCPGCIETNPFLGKHPSNGGLIAMGSAAFGIETTLHILSRKYGHDDNSRAWSFASYALVPGADAALSIRVIVHNYSLASKPRPAPSSSMTFGRPQSTISPTVPSIVVPGPFERGDKHWFIPPDQLSASGRRFPGESLKEKIQDRQ